VKRFSGKPFALLGVNSDEDREALEKIVVEERITWRSWWDEGRIDGPIHTNWQVVQRPSIHILDDKGVIRYKNIPPEQIDAAIEELLEELADER